MDKNTISVRAYLVNGDVYDILDKASSKEAIREYLFPDASPPVQSIAIEIMTDDGKKINISINDKIISAKF